MVITLKPAIFGWVISIDVLPEEFVARVLPNALVVKRPNRSNTTCYSLAEVEYDRAMVEYDKAMVEYDKAIPKHGRALAK